MPVWQIAFETSAREGSVALLREDVLVLQILLDGQTRTAQSLAPAVKSLLDRLRDDQAELGFVSVAVGPGSFTGLRIGVTAAKTLAFTRNCPVVRCDTLSVIASQVRRNMGNVAGENAGATGSAAAEVTVSEIDVAMNAYRGQVFHRRESFGGAVSIESEAIDNAEWFAAIQKDADTGTQLLLAGDIWKTQNAKLDQQASPGNDSGGLRLTPEEYWAPTAAEVGQLARQKFERGETDTCLSVTPNYLRESAAVEKKSASKT